MDFSNVLIKWYRQHKRDLPWRNITDPYKIWLSEIILQQTRVDQGMPYYLRFIDHYPTVNDLAKAHEEEVLKLWQGLGYYSRARNLHTTAKYIANELNGVFPNTYEDLLKLKGIGEYTAAAIASFSYQLPYPVIDGNVYRVLSRIFNVVTPIDTGTGKKQFKELAATLIDKSNPGEYNQAIMEFGALYCKPQSPNCEHCVFNIHCMAHAKNKANELPVKSKKLKQKDRYFNYLVFSDQAHTYIKQRNEKDIWKGLFDFPLIETPQKINSIFELNTQHYELLLNQHLNIHRSEEKIHLLSHQKIHAVFWWVELKSLPIPLRKELKIKWKEIHNYAVPKLMENYIHEKVKMSTFEI